ncbi:RNA 3'-terminal phosphate cyclase [Pseudoduganella sp. GCM10020061]|uniref:RNA 3'-terminal phosphate cyclase n=1 Tax=Pseudoduganella sp. GCM10020061 TaxID=3317345 RepID=UPI00363DAE01
MVELDGSHGEGGGQMLRTSLSLSMITGQPFRMVNIRANRAKPGLARQHLVAVTSAARISGAETSDVKVGSTELEFHPGRVTPGEIRIDIGTAGSATLVLQTLLPALLLAGQPSTLVIHGGTHNPMAPPAHFIDRAFGRALRQMGAVFELELRRFGFYPRGGGELAANIVPCRRLQPIDLIARGPCLNAFAEGFVAALPPDIARRELDEIGAAFKVPDANLRMCGLPNDQGPGNVLLFTMEHEHVTEVFSAIGERGTRAEEVGRRVAAEARAYCDSDGAAGEHLADQLLMPLALAGGGSFSMAHLSQHTLTNADVIHKFLPVRIQFTREPARTICSVEA